MRVATAAVMAATTMILVFACSSDVPPTPSGSPAPISAGPTSAGPATTAAPSIGPGPTPGGTVSGPTGSGGPGESTAPTDTPGTLPSTAPGPTLGPTPSEPAPPSEPPPPSEPAAAFPFPGLYVTPAVAMSGSETYATVTSSLDCLATQDMLGAGDWSVVAAADLVPVGTSAPPGTHGTRWVLLQRGEDLALASLRGTDDCVGSVERLRRAPFRVSGAETVETTATMIPAACVEGGDGRVAVLGFYDADGGWIGRMDVTVIPNLGERAIAPADLGSSPPLAAHVGRSLFETVAAGIDPSASGELNPGDAFSGTLTIEGLDPLAGSVRLSGLVDDNGRSVSLEAGFSCHVTAFRGGTPAPVSERQGIALHLTSTLDVSGDYGVKSTTAVDLAGVMEAVTPRRYEATVTATGSGTFNEADYSDLGTGRRCTGTWSGSQAIDVAAEVSPDALHLVFTPSGAPTTTFSKPCNVEAHGTDLTLPFAYALSGTLDVAWPPGTPGNDHQTIDLPIPGLGNDQWEVTFTSAP